MSLCVGNYFLVQTKMYVDGEIFIHVGNFNGEDNYITALMFLSLRIITTEYGFPLGQ
jgi:hypothetical protein